MDREEKQECGERDEHTRLDELEQPEPIRGLVDVHVVRGRVVLRTGRVAEDVATGSDARPVES